MSPFRIFCGADERQAECSEVFAWSVRETASIPVDVRFVSAVDVPASRQGITRFTYARFMVPALSEYHGIALFADGADMLCLGDVAELADLAMDDFAVRVVMHPPGPDGKQPRSWSSVMLMDCSRLHAWSPSHVARWPDDMLMRFTSLPDGVVGGLPPEWNLLVPVGEEPPPGAKIAHWTSISDPRGESWIDRSGSTVWREWRERWRLSL